MAKKDNTIAILTHIFAYFTWVIGPIVVLLASEDAFAKQNAKTALNWQISLAIYGLVSLVLVFLLVGIPLLILIGLLDVIFTIVAAIKAADGKLWHYPGAIRFFNP